MEDALTSTPEQIFNAQIERVHLDPYTLMADMALATLVRVAQADRPAIIRKKFLDLIVDEPGDEYVDVCDLQFLDDARILIEKDEVVRPSCNRVEHLAAEMDMDAQTFSEIICRVAVYRVLLCDPLEAVNEIRKAAERGYELSRSDTDRPKDNPAV